MGVNVFRKNPGEGLIGSAALRDLAAQCRMGRGDQVGREGGREEAVAREG